MKTKLQTQKNIVLFSPLKSCRNALNGLNSVFLKRAVQNQILSSMLMTFKFSIPPWPICRPQAVAKYLHDLDSKLERVCDEQEDHTADNGDYNEIFPARALKPCNREMLLSSATGCRLCPKLLLMALSEP